jgi:hypothetical protein
VQSDFCDNQMGFNGVVALWGVYGDWNLDYGGLGDDYGDKGSGCLPDA